MLDDMRKKGKPVTPKVEEMALWLDSLDTSSLDDGQVSRPHTPAQTCCITHTYKFVVHKSSRYAEPVALGGLLMRWQGHILA